MQSCVSIKNVTHWLKIHHLEKHKLYSLLSWGVLLETESLLVILEENMMTYDGDASHKGCASKLPSTCLIPSPYLTLPFTFFDLWCWRRLLRIPWTARRSNQSILQEISPGCSLEGMMLKLKLQYFGHLM